MRYILLIIFALSIVIDCNSQDWEAMDYGIKSGSFLEVKDINVNPETGDVFVGGHFYRDGIGQNMIGLTRWDELENRWDTAFGGFSCSDFGFYDNVMYANGSFTVESLVDNGQFHIRSNNNWAYNPLGANNTVYGSSIIDGKLYMVGAFSMFGGVPSYGIGVYDGENFQSISTENHDAYHRLDGVAEFQDEVYIVGKTAYGLPSSNWWGLSKISGDSLVTVHDEFTGSFFQIWIYSLEVYQNQLYIGGYFHTGEGFTGNGIQSFDGQNMYSVGGGVNSVIFDMKVYEGELYVAGFFTHIGEGVSYDNWEDGEPCNGLAKWNGSNWTCLNNSNLDGGHIETIEIYQDTLYIGGDFGSIDGDTTMSLIARKRIYPDTTLTSINEDLPFPNFNIYPNPSQGDITINFGEALKKEATMEIYNHVGQLVKQNTIARGWQKYQLGVGDLPKGIYLIQIYVGDHRLSRRLVYS